MTSILSRQIPEEEEQREVLAGKTQDMIEDSFFANLKKTDKKMANEIEAKVGHKDVVVVPSSANTERLLLDLFDVRDGLIRSFENVGLNTSTANDLASNINKLGSCIRNIGGEVKDFAPLEHLSGLQTPDLLKSAQKVIDSTKQCYSLGKITKAEVESDGQVISINFEGIEGDISYTARGTITAESSWKGNEAIDYIYTTGAGRMSVKAFENNKWVDKCDDYNLYWELDEINVTASSSPSEVEETVTEEKVENKEEKDIEAQNNLDNKEEVDVEIDSSFPIEEN